jgi:5-methylcytosine-specific restriction endonuclease McrA
VDTIELVEWINKLIHYNNIKAFYNSSLWLKVRSEVLEEQHHECQRCKAKGLYSEAVTVHHIEYLRKHPELALTKINLEAICEGCHYDEHHRYKPKPQLNIERW